MRTLLQHLLPHKILSKIAYLCANCKIVWIKNYLIRYFLKRYPVNMNEAIQSNPYAFNTYNDFFTRKLKPECRPIDSALNAVVSPADGAIAQIGTINAEDILQAKGHNYKVVDLLGGNSSLAAQFNNGSFATIYLAPKDYHRVHMPLTGTLQQMQYIPGKLFSVNTHAAENIPNVFARNERVVSIFNTAAGPMAVILVGAMIVGSMETKWHGIITPPHSKRMQTWQYHDKPIEIAKGEEMGLFKLGSTVIILFAPNAVIWDHDLTANMDIRFGAKIGVLTE